MSLIRIPTALIALALAVLPAVPATAQPTARLGFSPDRYIIDLDEGGTAAESLMVKNLSDEPVTVKLSVGHWEFDENYRIRLLPPAEDSLDRWIVINPLRVTIPPGSPQTIRWAVLPRSKPKDGEYRAIIFVEEEIEDSETSTGTTARVRMKMRMGIPVYARAGTTIKRTAVDRFAPDAEGRAVDMALANEGNVHARLQGRYGIWRSRDYPGDGRASRLLADATAENAQEQGFRIEAVPEVVVLPGETREARLEPPLAGPGSYVLHFLATFGDTAIEKSLTLEVEAD